MTDGATARNRLELRAAATQDAGLNSAIFSITPGTAYTFSVSARIAPASAGSGYFVLIFLGAGDEGQRLTVPIRAPEVALGTATTDARGMFALRLESPPSPVGVVTARFAGDEVHWPATAEAP